MIEKNGLLLNPTTLRELREKHGMSQEEVAHRVGLTRVAYSRYESGQSEPKLTNFLAIAKFYQIPLKELATLMRYDVEGIPDEISNDEN